VLNDSDKLFAAIDPVFSRYGLSLRDNSGNPLEGDALRFAVADYARGVLKEKIRRRDGQPVRPEVIDEILQSIDFVDVPEGFEKSKRYEEALKQGIVEIYGNEEALGLVLKPLVYRILGLYRGDLFAEPRKFVYHLEMPGVIVETSGELLSDRLARFSFSDAQAFPFGFAMTCRSLQLTKSAPEFLGAGIGADRARLFAYVDLVRGDDVLIEVVRECVAAGNIKPLQRAREASAPGSSDTARYDALLAMLKPAGKSGD
jgi:hypothetical protein